MRVEYSIKFFWVIVTLFFLPFTLVNGRESEDDHTSTLPLSIVSEPGSVYVGGFFLLDIRGDWRRVDSVVFEDKAIPFSYDDHEFLPYWIVPVARSVNPGFHTTSSIHETRCTETLCMLCRDFSQNGPQRVLKKRKQLSDSPPLCATILSRVTCTTLYQIRCVCGRGRLFTRHLTYVSRIRTGRCGRPLPMLHLDITMVSTTHQKLLELLVTVFFPRTTAWWCVLATTSIRMASIVSLITVVD